MNNSIKDGSRNSQRIVGLYDKFGYKIGEINQEYSSDFSEKTEFEIWEDVNGSEKKIGAGEIERKKNDYSSKGNLFKNYQNSLGNSSFSYLGSIVNTRDLQEKLFISNLGSFKNFYVSVEEIEDRTRTFDFQDGSPITHKESYQKSFGMSFISRTSNQLSYSTYDRLNDKVTTRWVSLNIDLNSNEIKIGDIVNTQTMSVDDIDNSSISKVYLGKPTIKEWPEIPENVKLVFNIYGVLNKTHSSSLDDSGDVSIRNLKEDSLLYESSSLVTNGDLTLSQLFPLSKSYNNNSITYSAPFNIVDENDTNSYCLSHDENNIHKFSTLFISFNDQKILNGTELFNSELQNKGNLDSINEYDLLLAEISVKGIGNSESAYFNFNLVFDRHTEGNSYTTIYEDKTITPRRLAWKNFIFDSGLKEISEIFRIVMSEDSSVDNNHTETSSNIATDSGSGMEIKRVWGHKFSNNATNRNAKNTKIEKPKLSAVERLKRIRENG